MTFIPIARSETTKQSHETKDEIAALPVVARNDTIRHIRRIGGE